MTRRIPATFILLMASAVAVLAQMPDVSQMSGVPLPSGELPNGTVSIRVVRGGLGNDVVGLDVELHGAGQVWKAVTDGEERAQFTQAAPGTRVHAVAQVDGQRLESQEFPVPPKGGVRVALVVEPAKEMTAKAAQKNLLLLTAFKFRYFDEVQKAKEILSSGGLGKIASFRLMFGGYIDMAGTWFAQKHLSGGGILMDNGPHAIDLIRYLFGEITAVSAAVSNLQDIPVEDTGRLNFTLANGVTGTAEMSWSLPIPSKTYLEIYGENGAALLDFEGISYKFKTWDEWKRIPNGLDVKGTFARQTDHFIASIITKNPSIVCREDGEKSQVVVQAAYESSREGKTIRVS